MSDQRQDRFDRLIEEYGCADGCLPQLRQCRWLLMEADEGPADNGGPWWTTGDDWRDLLDVSANQEYPGDWPARTLFDLDSDWSSDLRMAYVLKTPLPEGVTDGR